MNILFVLSLLLLSFSPLFTIAQTATQTINEIKQQPLKVVQQEAERLYNQGSYQQAYYYYTALQDMRKKSSIEDDYRLGKTALEAHAYDVSQATLQSLLPKAKRFPMIQYEYALALKYLGNYVPATQHFQSYINAHQGETNNEYVFLAQTHLKSCQKAMEEKAQISAWFFNDLTDTSKLDTAVVYRALTRPSKHNYRLVECQTAAGTCLKKVAADNSITELAGVLSNPAFNSSSPHISPDGETVFFAQQELGETDYKIFQATMNADGELTGITKLGPSVNRAGFSSTHPTIGETQYGQKILYFASTLPGSQGGYDIWYAIQLTSGEFTMAYNLGSRINGPKDEITPFYYQEDGELYFSSEKPQGYGGLDVYKMTGEKKRWEESQAFHLSQPINSTGNEFYYRKTKRGKGSFSTDRDGKKEKTVTFKKNIGA